MRLLIEDWADAADGDHEARVRERRETILRYSGALAGMYPPGYLDEVRGGDPE